MKKKVLIIGFIVLFVVACITIFLLLNKKVTISFDADGGTEVQSVEVKKGGKINLPITDKEGYIFSGWYMDTTKVSNDTTYEKDVTLKAKWIKEGAKTFTVTFDSDGGTSVESITVECGSELSLPANPTKSGFRFLSWIDKNGTPIYDKALLSCENISLKANWEKEEDKKETKETPKTETKEPTKTYSCPNGYKLEGTKCTTEGTVRETCPSDTRVDGALCIRISDYSKGTRQCKEETISIDGKGHTWTGRGEYYEAGLGICGYYVWDNITSQDQCTTNIYRIAEWGNGKCYAKKINNNYETVCSDDYQYYTSAQLESKFGAHNNGGCYKKVAKTKYCDEGYTLTSGKCIKTIDATLK